MLKLDSKKRFGHLGFKFALSRRHHEDPLYKDEWKWK